MIPLHEAIETLVEGRNRSTVSAKCAAAVAVLAHFSSLGQPGNRVVPRANWQAYKAAYEVLQDNLTRMATKRGSPSLGLPDVEALVSALIDKLVAHAANTQHFALMAYMEASVKNALIDLRRRQHGDSRRTQPPRPRQTHETTRPDRFDSRLIGKDALLGGERQAPFRVIGMRADEIGSWTFHFRSLSDEGGTVEKRRVAPGDIVFLLRTTSDGDAGKQSKLGNGAGRKHAPYEIPSLCFNTQVHTQMRQAADKFARALQRHARRVPFCWPGRPLKTEDALWILCNFKKGEHGCVDDLRQALGLTTRDFDESIRKKVEELRSVIEPHVLAFRSEIIDAISEANAQERASLLAFLHESRQCGGEDEDDGHFDREWG